MADRNWYPQIPSTVWWGVRSILERSPSATIDERMLAVSLGVQPTAAKAYVSELRRVGILTDQSKATPLAQRWKLDGSYAEAVDELIRAVYPQGLVDLAPPGEADRQKVVTWFQHEGFGKGAAGNKAATYLLLSSPTPNEAPKASPKASTPDTTPRPRASRKAASSSTAAFDVPGAPAEPDDRNKKPAVRSTDAFPLNVNVQIHISADAGTEQIESIFQAMRRYLYDAPAP